MVSLKAIYVALLVSLFFLLAGCGGSSSVASSPYTGSWNGTWVNVNDSSDAGTSVWNIDGNGNVDGHDFDPGRSTTFHVVGTVSSTGTLATHSTPVGGSPATLDGTLQFGGAGQISGVLAWGVTPVLNYQYSFSRN